MRSTNCGSRVICYWRTYRIQLKVFPNSFGFISVPQGADFMFLPRFTSCSRPQVVLFHKECIPFKTWGGKLTQSNLSPLFKISHTLELNIHVVIPRQNIKSTLPCDT